MFPDDVRGRVPSRSMQPTKLVERERTPMALMLYGVYLYYAPRSLRLASRALERITRRSHVSIWKWVQRFAPVADRFSVDRRDREHVKNRLKLFVLHIHLEMDLPRDVSFLCREVSLS